MKEFEKYQRAIIKLIKEIRNTKALERLYKLALYLYSHKG